MENFLVMLKWAPLVPILAEYPKLENDLAENMPEAQQAVTEMRDILTSPEAKFLSGRIQIWFRKHEALIKLVQTDAPSMVKLNSALAPTVQQILQE